jgi:hypothetical protein
MLDTMFLFLRKMQMGFKGNLGITLFLVAILLIVIFVFTKFVFVEGFTTPTTKNSMTESQGSSVLKSPGSLSD